jgi:hypothetical protein
MLLKEYPKSRHPGKSLVHNYWQYVRGHMTPYTDPGKRASLHAMTRLICIILACGNAYETWRNVDLLPYVFESGFRQNYDSTTAQDSKIIGYCQHNPFAWHGLQLVSRLSSSATSSGFSCPQQPGNSTSAWANYRDLSRFRINPLGYPYHLELISDSYADLWRKSLCCRC